MEKTEVDNFDHVYKVINGRGRFQWLLLLIVSMQLMVLTMHHMGSLFLGAEPKHWCYVDELFEAGWTPLQIQNFSAPLVQNADGLWIHEKCEVYNWNYSKILYDKVDYDSAMETRMAQEIPRGSTMLTKTCNKWFYDTEVYGTSLVSRFDLVCDRRSLAAAIQSTYQMGILIGSITMSTLSDRFLGRRKTVLIAVVIVSMAGLGATWSSSYLGFIAFRFLIAIGVSGSFQGSYVLLLEYTDPSYRSIFGLVEQLPFAVGYMLIALYAYLLKNWQTMQLAFTITTWILFSYYWILPASARWHASKGENNKCMGLLRRVAVCNNRLSEFEAHYTEIFDCVERCEETDVQTLQMSTLGNKLLSIFHNFWSLVKTPKLRHRSLAIWTLYFSVTIVYYGISFGSIKLSDDPYFVVFLSALMEIPAYTVTPPIIKKIGRRPLICIGFLLTGAVLLGMTFIPSDYQMLRITLIMLGKLNVSASFAVIYLLAAELYPTALRSTGLGSAVIIGRFGSMVAPFIIEMRGDSSVNYPILILGMTAFFASVVSLTVPETRKVPLPDKVEHVEAAALEKLKKKDETYNEKT